MTDPLIGATTAVFAVTLSVALSEPVDVAWTTKDGSGKAGVDYEAANGVVTFLPGETAKQIQVTVYGREEGTGINDRTFYIVLTPPTNAVLGNSLVECIIKVEDESGEPVTTLVVAQGKRGFKGDPGLSAYEQAVLMGYQGTVEQWMNEIADASQAAERAGESATSAAASASQASAAAASAAFAGRIYPTPEAGVDPVTGVPNNAYYNVRSSSNDSFIDEYQNVNGVATPTGKSFPSSQFVQTVSDYTALPFVTGKAYAINRRVQLANGDIVKNIVIGNTNNPNVDMNGWVKTNDASQIFDESGKNQQEVNNNLYQSINVFTNRTRGFVSLFEFIPSALHSKLKDFSTSKEQVGDVSVYIQQALDYAASNRVDVLAPFAFYFINNTINVPPRVRFVGLSQPYILGLDTFVDEALLSTDQAGQFEFYIDNFYLNGIAGKNLVGLHIGGCRNSTFKQLQITACFKASVWVHPTHPDSGDVENIELDHIWSVRGAGLLFQTNSGISRGNITDGTITNCQLTSGDTNVKDGFPLALIASQDRYIFGLKFDRIFTKTTDETHILVNPNGGMIYGNEFSFFTGESWVMGSGAPSLAFNQSTMYVLDGAFQKNKFTNFYMTGLQGNGVSLGSGSVDNTFDGLICNDFSPTYDNKWIEFRFGADRNICNNVNIDYGLKIEDGAPCANNIFGKKIINLGQSNIVSGGKITTTPPTLVKRDRIFQNNGVQLTNYPVEGCGFSTVNGNLSVSIPAGATPYYLQIPFDTTATFRGDRVAAMLNYQFNASANGLILAMHLGDTGKQITDYTVGKDGVMVFTAPLVSDRKKLVISFLGNRAADVNFIIKDIVIVQGNQIPYLYGYNKLYIEN